MKNCLVLFVVLILIGCKEDEDGIGVGSPSGSGSTWLISDSEVFDGGPGKDGIPSIDNPKFVSVSAAGFILDPELVIGFYDKEAGIHYAYPHQILDWHEIVNHDLSTIPLAITYCPLTGTAIGWNRQVEGVSDPVDFGVSGLIYRNNLMPYDRATNSTWSQMRQDCVNGSLIGTRIEQVHLVETTWEKWKQMYPDSKILSLETGFDRTYGSYPYGDYRTTNNFLFPRSNTDNRIFSKERVLGVIGNSRTKIYTFETLGTKDNITQDVIDGSNIIVVGSPRDKTIVSFYFPSWLTNSVTFSLSEDETSLFQDSDGNKYDIFGKSISGPDAGSQLEPVRSYMGYWFSWPEFHNSLSVY